MSDTLDVVALVLEGRATRAHCRALIQRAPALLGTMIQRIERDPIGAYVALAPFFRHTGTEENLERLLALAEDCDTVELQIAAIEAIGVSRLPAAYDALVEMLATSPFTADVAEAIGLAGDPRGVDPLRAHAARLLGNRQGSDAMRASIEEARACGSVADLRELLAVARGCARLGDHSLAFVPIALAGRTAQAGDPSELEDVARPEAARTLQLVVGPGMLEALRAAAFDQGYELRRGAVEALYLLGTPMVVPELLAVVADSDARLARLAHALLVALVGAPATEDAPALVTWWDANAGRFDPDRAYRAGRLFQPSTSIDALSDPDSRALAAWDLRHTTGRDFTYDSAADTAGWWRDHDDEYQPGRLYKLGFALDLPPILTA